MCLHSLEDRQCCYAERLGSEDLTMGQVSRRFRGLVMGAIALAVSVLLAQGLHLGGGSSSTLVYQGTTHYGRLNGSGEWVQRPVKSILWIEDSQ